ncbi:hypothetical protein E2C01_098361 [Portunus trituberculatus]|uniref:Uncharacterized protein n=1 Tax=Portunus trituberculatus TaxID=210409 RepID=A0A5B7KCQ1_PORTR|nr:hypothetical protein [Portunus trituberculatus]
MFRQNTNAHNVFFPSYIFFLQVFSPSHSCLPLFHNHYIPSYTTTTTTITTTANLPFPSLSPGSQPASQLVSHLTMAVMVDLCKNRRFCATRGWRRRLLLAGGPHAVTGQDTP